MEWQKCGTFWEPVVGMVLLYKEGVLEEGTEALVGDCNFSLGTCGCCDLPLTPIGWAWATQEWLEKRRP